MNESLQNNGFVVIPNVYTAQEIDRMRAVSLNYFQNGGGFKNSGGHAKPDWIKEDSLNELLNIFDMKKIEKIVSGYVGENVSFIGHNDLHLNRSVGWHKDQLNGEARKFQIHSPWEIIKDQVMKIYKVNFYLQDHSKNNDGLAVRVGSHKSPEMNQGIIKQIFSKSGDIVLFDQRITHRAKWSGGYDRLLICVGFGVKNIFFDEFKKGTQYRQNKQNGLK